jgi:cytoskeletal protein RodZ
MSEHQQERQSRQERRKQKRNRRGIAFGGILATLFIVGGWLYMLTNNDASQATSTLEKPKTTDQATKNEKSKKEAASTKDPKEAKKEKKKSKKKAAEYAQAAWVTRPFANVYRDASRSSVIYKADLGDVYEVLDAKDGMVHLKLNDSIEEYLPETDVRLEAQKGTSDKAVLTALSQAVANQPIDKPEQYLGKPIAEFEAKYGAVGNTQQDAVNTYYFSNAGYLLVVSDGIIEAIDWTNASTNALSTLGEPVVDTSYGTWYEGESLQLKVFPDNGKMRLRLARDPGQD